MAANCFVRVGGIPGGASRHRTSAARFRVIGRSTTIWRRRFVVIWVFPNQPDSDSAQDPIGFRSRRCALSVEAGTLPEVVAHPNPRRCPPRKVMVVEVVGYAYLVPFIEEADHFFLKTIIPSRKAARDFIAKESDHDSVRCLRTRGSSGLRVRPIEAVRRESRTSAPA